MRAGWTIPPDRYHCVLIEVPDPGAGLPFIYRPAVGVTERLVSGRFLLSTGNIVAGRVVCLQLTDGASDYVWVGSGVSQPLNTAYYYNFLEGIGTYMMFAGNNVIIPWGRCVFLTNSLYLRVTAPALQVVDQFSLIYLWVERTIED